MNVDYEALEMFVYRCLEEGVPTATVSRIFGLDHELIKECIKQVRVHRYGTDDLVDYTAQLQWDALEEAKRIMSIGQPSERSRFAAAVLGKTLAIQGRRTPEKLVEAQEQIRELFTSMRTGTAKQSPGADPKFLAYGEGDDNE